MTTFNPRDWWDPFGWFEGPKQNRPEDFHREVTLRWTMAVTFCVWVASLAPAHLFVTALAGFLFLAGLASMGLACLQGHDPLANHLTAWDEALWSLTISVGLQAWLTASPTAM
jgi:hypothetical protein